MLGFITFFHIARNIRPRTAGPNSRILNYQLSHRRCAQPTLNHCCPMSNFFGPSRVLSELILSLNTKYLLARTGWSEFFSVSHSFSPSLVVVAALYDAHFSRRHSSFPQSGEQCKANQRSLLYLGISNRCKGRPFCLCWHPIQFTSHALCIVYSWYVHFFDLFDEIS